MRSIDPAMKFLGLLSVTILLAWRYDPGCNLFVTILCIALLAASRVPIRRIAAVSFPLLLAACGLFFTGYRFSAASNLPVRTDTLFPYSAPLWNGLAQASRGLAYGFVGLLFTLTTDRIALIRSFQQRFHIPPLFSYSLLAAWGIVPQMLLEYRKAKAAFRARGRRVLPMSPALLRPLLVKSVRWSEALSMAMEAKGFSADAARTQLDSLSLHVQDWFFLISCLIVPLVL